MGTVVTKIVITNPLAENAALMNGKVATTKMKIRNLRRIESTGDWVCSIIVGAPGGWFAINNVFYNEETGQIRFPHVAGNKKVKIVGAAGQTVNALRQLIDTEIARLTTPV